MQVSFGKVLCSYLISSLALVFLALASLSSEAQTPDATLTQADVATPVVLANTRATFTATVNVTASYSSVPNESVSFVTSPNVANPAWSIPIIPDYVDGCNGGGCPIAVPGTYHFSGTQAVYCASPSGPSSVTAYHYPDQINISNQLTITPPTLTWTVLPSGQVSEDGTNFFQATLTMDPPPAQGNSSYTLKLTSSDPGLIDLPVGDVTLGYPNNTVTFFFSSKPVSQATSLTVTVEPAIVEPDQNNNLVTLNSCGSQSANITVKPFDPIAPDLGPQCSTNGECGQPIYVANGNTYI